MGNRSLPGEMLETVFRHLPPKDLKVAVMVCKWWALIGQAPSLWSWVTINIDEENIDFLKEALATRRLQNVNKLSVMDVSESMLKEIGEHSAQHSCPMKIDFRGVNLSFIESSLLARVLKNFEEVNLGRCKLRTDQVTSLCEAIIDQNTNNSSNSNRVKVLQVWENNLSGVEPYLLATAILQLEEVNLLFSRLTPQHGQAIFSSIASGQTNLLRILRIAGNRLNSIEAEVVANALNKLVTADLRKTSLTCRQMKKVLDSALKGTKLKRLRLGQLGEDEENLDERLVKEAREAIGYLQLDLPTQNRESDSDSEVSVEDGNVAEE